MAEAYDLAKRLKDKRIAERAKIQAAKLAAEFAESEYEAFPVGIDLHMASVVDDLIVNPPKKFSWLNKSEAPIFDKIQHHLRPYQKMAVMLTIRNKKTGQFTLNASDVGTGKTRVAALAAITMKFKRVLWLTSVNLVKPTIEEIMRVDGVAFATGDRCKFWLDLPMNKVADTIFYVTNYQVMYRDAYLNIPGPKGPQWDCIIIDECTILKGGASYNPTKIWKETKELCNDTFPTTYKMFLSATPGENDPAEIWAYLNIFDPERFDSYAKFRKVFCLRNKEGKLIFTADRLLEMLGGMCIRQTVKSIKEQFPNYDAPNLDDVNWFSAITVPLTIDPASSVGRAYIELYNEMLTDLTGRGDVLKPKIMLEVMLRCRQLLSCGPKFTYSKTFYTLEQGANSKLDEEDPNYDPWDVRAKKNVDTKTVNMEPPFTKHDAVEEKIAELQSMGEPVVVFSCFNQPLTNLHNALSRTGVYRSGLLIGTMKQAERDEVIRQFQQGELDVLLVNKLTGGQGLNLQQCDLWPGGARFIIHMDRWWNPAKERQANGRCVRMNTKYPVTAYYFEVENSMDEVMRKIVESKADALESLDRGMILDSMNRAMLG